jgi:hypothetical protein
MAGEGVSGRTTMDLKVEKDLKIAGDEQAIESSLKVIGESDIEDLISEPYYKQIKKMFKTITEETQSSINKRNEERQIYIDAMNGKNIDKAVMLFNQRVMKEDDISDKYYQDLKSKGYQGVIDLNDVNAATEAGKYPMIIFDRGSNVKTISSGKLTQKDIDDAMLYLDKLYGDDDY